MWFSGERIAAAYVDLARCDTSCRIERMALADFAALRFLGRDFGDAMMLDSPALRALPSQLLLHMRLDRTLDNSASPLNASSASSGVAGATAAVYNSFAARVPATWVRAVWGEGLELDSGMFLRVGGFGDSVPADLSDRVSEMSVSVWLRFGSMSGIRVLSDWDSAANRGWRIENPHTVGTASFTIMTDSGEARTAAVNPRITNPLLYGDGHEWRHVVAVLQRPCTLLLYHDGEEVARNESKIPCSMLRTAKADLLVHGSPKLGEARAFDELMLWNRSLRPEEVVALYYSGARFEACPAQNACVAGSQLPCVCPNGQYGVSVCVAGIAEFDSCICAPSDCFEPSTALNSDLLENRPLSWDSAAATASFVPISWSSSLPDAPDGMRWTAAFRLVNELDGSVSVQDCSDVAQVLSLDSEGSIGFSKSPKGGALRLNVRFNHFGAGQHALEAASNPGWFVTRVESHFVLKPMDMSESDLRLRASIYFRRVSFGWVRVGWSACSESCGNGVHMSIAECRSLTGALGNLSSDLCSEALKPQLTVACALRPCGSSTAPMAASLNPTPKPTTVMIEAPYDPGLSTAVPIRPTTAPSQAMQHTSNSPSLHSQQRVAGGLVLVSWLWGHLRTLLPTSRGICSV